MNNNIELDIDEIDAKYLRNEPIAEDQKESRLRSLNKRILGSR